MIDINDIERKAKAATPGPWSADTGEPGDAVVWGPGEDNLITNIGPSRVNQCWVAFDGEKEDCEFIAAANPAAVLALVSLLREAENLLSDSADYNESWDHSDKCRKLAARIRGNAA